MVNRDNYHLRNEFLKYLREVRQRDEKTVGRYDSYLRHTLLWADETSLAEAHMISPSLPEYLKTVTTKQGKTLAQESVDKTIDVSKQLLRYAVSHRAAEFKRLPAAFIYDLTAPEMPAAPPPERATKMYELEEVCQLARVVVAPEDIATQRDQAAAALLYLSGMRIGALLTLPIEALDLESRTVRQWPSLGVHTKNRKSATTYLLNIPALLEVVRHWDAYVREHLPLNAPWYPPLTHVWGAQALSEEEPGEERHSGFVRRLHQLCERAGIAYKTPHAFRHGHAVYSLLRARTLADYKAISQNLMHGDIKVTDSIYAVLLPDEVSQRVGVLSERPAEVPSEGSDLAGALRGRTKSEIAEALRILAEELAR